MTTFSKPAPKISIITVVRNGEATLRGTIESVLERIGSNAEYLIVDGASTDGTMAIIDKYAGRLAHVVSEPDKGIYDAMNKALDVARGDWVLFLGADDELAAPLDEIAKRLTRPDAVYYGNVIIMATGRESAGRFNRYRLMQQNICHQAILYPRVVYRAKKYAIDVGMLADHKYNIEVWGSGTPFIYVDEVLSRFNDEGASSTGQLAFEPIKMAAIRKSFGLSYYLLKRVRSGAVALLKGRREPA